MFEPKHFAFTVARTSKFNAAKRRGKSHEVSSGSRGRLKESGYGQKAEEVILNRRGCRAAQASPIKRFNLISVEGKWKSRACVFVLKES